MSNQEYTIFNQNQKNQNDNINYLQPNLNSEQALSQSKSILNSNDSSSNINSQSPDIFHKVQSLQQQNNNILKPPIENQEIQQLGEIENSNQNIQEQHSVQNDQSIQLIQSSNLDEQQQSNSKSKLQQFQRPSVISKDSRQKRGISNFSQSSINTPEASPDVKMEKQNKLILRTQKNYELEVEERNEEAARSELIEQLKTQFAFKAVRPFDLLIMYDEATVEFQIRPTEIDIALKSVNIDLTSDQLKIISKYYKVQNKDTISTIKFCYTVVEDLGELVLNAINYIINKYRLVTEIFFEELTQQDRLLSVDTIKILNKEWEWGLEEREIQKIYNSMTDNGNNLFNYEVFQQKLKKISQQVDNKFNQQCYQQLVRLIIKNNSVFEFSELLINQDQAQAGEVAVYIFQDLISMYINRALSKQELTAIRLYLQKEKDEEVVIYNKLLSDALKIIEEDNIIKLQETDKQKQQQRKLLLLYFNSIVNKTNSIPDQYFVGEQQFKIDQETFINHTVELTGFQINQENAEILYQMIIEDKLDKTDQFINVIEFTQFINKKKIEITQPEQNSRSQSKQQLQLSKENLLLQSPPNEQQNRQSLMQPSSLKLQQQISQGKSQIINPNSQIISGLNQKLQLENKQQSQLDVKLDKSDRQSLKTSQIEKKNDKSSQDLKQEKKDIKNDKKQDKDKQQQEKQQQEKQQQQLPQSLRFDIYSFFDELDTQRVKCLSQQQLFMGLLSIGIILPKNELSKFKSCDYYQFERIIMDQLQLIYNSAKLIYNLRKEFDQYKDYEGDLIGMQMFKQLCENIRLNVKFEDIIYIYQTLDKERTGFIKLSDIFYLIYQHPKVDYRLNELLFRMKGYYDNSLNTQKQVFEKLPQHFIRPFTRNANLTSYSFRIKPDPLGNFITEQKGQAWDLCKIKLLESQGIPSPSDKGNCFKREVIVAIYDNYYKKFVENSIILKVHYQQEKEDVWIFPQKNRNNGFYLNCEKIPHVLNLILIFELICYFKENGQVYKVSCGFCEIPITHILSFGTYTLPLKGGTLEQIIAINQKDIRCQRKGISGIIAKLGNDIVPQIIIKSQNRSRRPNLIKELETLPQLCLCHRNMTQIIYAYKRYCKDIIEGGENIYRRSIKMFLFSLDSPYISSKLCKLWNRIIVGKMIGQELEAFQILLGQLQKLIRLKDFNFNPYSPQEIFTPEIGKPKQNVVKSILDYTEYLIDSSFFNRLGLDGDEILKEQMDLYGYPLLQGIFDNENDPFDIYYNGLNLRMYDNYMQQIL